MQPIRVVIDAIHARSGGGISQLRTLLTHLADDPELEVHLVMHEAQDRLADPLDPRIQLHRVRFGDGFVRRLIWEQVALPVLARRLGADVTYAQANYGPLLAPGLVITFTNALAVGAEEKRLAKKFYWWALTAMTFASLLACRRAVAVSDYARRQVSSLPALRRKVAVVTPGIDPYFAEGEADAMPRRDAPFLLAVGDLYVQKNYATLVTAFSLLAPRFQELELLIAGAPIDPDHAAAIVRMIGELGLAARVHLIGRQDRPALRALYRHCAAFVFPSTVEAFGMPLAEAMVAGAPIAASSSTAMPEVAGEAALYFDPADAAGMAGQVERLLTEPTLRDRLIATGRERAPRFFGATVAAAMAAEFKVAARRGGRLQRGTATPVQ